MSTARGRNTDPSEHDRSNDDACSSFAASWMRGESPSIENYLDGIEETRCDAILTGLISLECELRRDRGEVPSYYDYSTRFPEQAAAIFGTTQLGMAATQADFQGLFEPVATDRGATRFRVLRPHAKGGLGVVLVAFDEEVRREVALKEIQDRYADHPISRARFLREAEITGGLEHPSIIPVYGLGQYSDGRPFYAMRFVRGESLQEAIASHHAAASRLAATERDLQLRRLLRRFLDLCNAMAYAHNRGILHRDLKPANVLLGPFGETLVVDWGLAKPIGQAEDRPEDEPFSRAGDPNNSALTQTGSTMGTPAYMSPEQASGGAASLGIASDIYSLGATLYCLLTGRAPMEGRDQADLLAKVRSGDFPPPRKVNPRVGRALDAVCRKAMALLPEHRYSTVRMFADDVERWLGDGPVSCYREPVLVRVGRWARKHRAAVFAAVGLLSIAATALAISTVLIGREQSRTRHQRDLALENYRQARSAVDELTHVAESQLLNVPGLQPLRKELLTSALAYYRRLGAQKSNDPIVQGELLAAQIRVGSIVGMIGSQEEAIAAYKEAIVLAETLVRHHPTLENRRDLAIAWNNRGIAESQVGLADDARHSIERALQVRRQLARDYPRDDTVTRELSAVYNNLGLQQEKAGRRVEAIRSLEQSLELRRQLVHRNPTSAFFRSNLAMTLFNLANRIKDQDRADDAIVLMKEGLSIREDLAKHHPEVAEYGEDLASALFNLGLAYRWKTNLDEAMKYLRRAREIQEMLVERNPDVIAYRSGLANTVYSMGSVLDDANRREEAFDLFRQARDIQKATVRLRPESIEPRYDLGWYCSQIGGAMGNAGRHSEAIEFFGIACDAFEAVLRKEPANVRRRGELAASLDGLGRSLFQLKRFPEAINAYQKAIESQERVIVDSHRDASNLETMGLFHRHLSTAQLSDGQGQLAATTARDRLRWVSSNPDDLYDAGRNLAFFATGPASNRDLDLAIQALRRSIAAGFRDRTRLLSDPAFRNLRSRPEFRAISFDLGFPADPFVSRP